MPRSRPSRADTGDLLQVDRSAMRPLAERMRPVRLDEMVGQRRLVAEGTALRTPLPLVLKHNRMGVGRRTLIERRADEAPRVHDAARARAAEVWHEPSERQTKRQRAQRERAARAEWLAVRASLK